VGIPEPATVWIAAAGAMWGIGRRKRTAKKTENTAVSCPMGLCAGNLPSDVFMSL
jgi:hypothetical protein